MTKSIRTVGVHEAKTTLSRLLREVEDGAEIEIVRGGNPVARLVPLAAPTSRRLGIDKGSVWIADDFDDPDDDISDDFESSVHVPA